MRARFSIFRDTFLPCNILKPNLGNVIRFCAILPLISNKLSCLTTRELSSQQNQTIRILRDIKCVVASGRAALLENIDQAVVRYWLLQYQGVNLAGLEKVLVLAVLDIITRASTLLPSSAC